MRTIYWFTAASMLILAAVVGWAAPTTHARGGTPRWLPLGSVRFRPQKAWASTNSRTFPLCSVERTATAAP